ncbi:hypothetical protein [Streptomyces sp. NPDC049040]|uniref:hypothetical protein n=1 Tax=Streptomyces sp. NPDC049040 TaxID=3365593 RepID=UPI003723E045
MGLLTSARRRGRRHDAELAQGMDLLKQGRTEEAEQLLGALARDRAARHRRVDPRTIEARKAHGQALLALDRPDDAAAVFTLLVAECRQAHGDNAFQVGAAALRLSEAQLVGGRHAEAEALARGTVADFTGREYSDGVHVRLRYVGRQVIGQAIEAAGRHAESLAWFEAMAPAAARDLGEEHVSALGARFSALGQLYMLGRSEEALAAAGSLVAATARMDDEWRAAAAASQVLALIGAGRPADAEAAVRAEIASRESLLGADHPALQTFAVHLTHALSELGRHDDALAVVSSMPVVVPEIRPAWALVRAEALHAAGHPDAPAAAREAVERCSARCAPTHYATLTARTLLAAVSGTPAERTALAALWEGHFGPAHPGTVRARRNAAA